MIEAAGFAPISTNDRVLVVGAGEHVWQPMLAAEALSLRGHDTHFITTTRSPILQGDTIRHKFSFPDHYGQGFWMYMHNVVPAITAAPAPPEEPPADRCRPQGL